MKMHARADAPSENAQSWPEDIFAVLQRFDIRQVAYVPDAGHSQLIERVLGASSMRAVPLTTEEEGVALLAGAWAGGQRGVLLMQSSGVGNCINMLSLTQIFRFPFSQAARVSPRSRSILRTWSAYCPIATVRSSFRGFAGRWDTSRSDLC
jgi:hypothetical protein